MNDLSTDNPKRPTVTVPEEEAPTIPLLGGMIRPDGMPEAADFDVTAIKPSSRSLNQGTMLIVGAFVVAASLLWVMKMGSGAGIEQGDRAIEQKIEQTLIQLTNPEAISPGSPFHPSHLSTIRGDAETIQRIFNVDYTQKQVPLEYVQKNPFRLAIVEAATPDGPAVQIDTAAAHRLKQMQNDFAKLKLQTIMKGRPNVAVINDEICREGQKIGPFTITKIDGLSVTVSAEGHDFTLQMDTGPRR